MIPPDTIERVRQASDIVDILGQYIRLRKRGRSFDALCPFHTEKTPSFKVSPDKQFYHCFGCGKGGNVYTFLMEHESMTFVEAVRFLASRAGITIRETRSDVKRESLDRLHYANAIAVEYYCEQLKSTKHGNAVLSYLRDKRSLTDEAIDFFRIGYATDSWDGLITYAARKDLKSAELKRAGLATYSDERKSYYDRFRQRLMIPIFSLSNKPIAFGGRTLRKADTVKYINSPETPLYVKGTVLYGLNFSRDSIRDKKAVYVVEGYFDLISLWQAGIREVVASSGTAFTLQQARLIARFADTALLFFDADTAGQTAALRSVGSLFDAGLDVRVMVLPKGEDPDSYARKFGRDGVEELAHDALPYIEFRLGQGEKTEEGIIARERLVKEFRDVGEKIHDPTRRALFFQKASESLGVPAAQFLSRPSTAHRDGTARPNAEKVSGNLEPELLSLLLCNPGSLDDVLNSVSPGDFDSPHYRRLYGTMIEQYRSRGEINLHRLLSIFEDDSAMASHISTVAAREWSPEIVEEQTKERLNEFVSRRQKRIRSRLMNELKEAEKNRDQVKASEIMRELKLHGL